MANRHRGEVDFSAGGKVWTLSFSVNALCDLEEVAGKSVREIMNEMEAGEYSVSGMRQLLWAGLRDHHEDVDLRDAGRIMTDLGGLARAGELVAEALMLAFPSEPAEAGGGGATDEGDGKKKTNGPDRTTGPGS